MDNITPFSSGFPLQELPGLTDEVLFAFHIGINKFIYLNTAFEEVWNMPRETISSNLPLLFNTIHPDDKTHVMDAFTAIIKDKQKQDTEFRIVVPNQEHKWINVKAYASPQSDNDIITGIAVDITATKSYSDTLHKFNDKKNSILQILAHDLLGPLGNIQLSTSLLAQKANLTTDESAAKLLDTITKSSKRSVAMIRDLINDEFLQSSQAAMVKQRVDIVEKLRTVIDQYQQSPNAIRQRFKLIATAETLLITIDESKFTQAINNLLSNALKFTADDGTIEVSIDESSEKNILIKVQDNGIGIPADMQPFLFDKFTKARRPGIHGEPTTGLGMSIIKTIVEWHNGRIWFESTEGKGTTFYVEIPKDS